MLPYPVPIVSKSNGGGRFSIFCLLETIRRRFPTKVSVYQVYCCCSAKPCELNSYRICTCIGGSAQLKPVQGSREAATVSRAQSGVALGTTATAFSPSETYIYVPGSLHEYRRAYRCKRIPGTWYIMWSKSIIALLRARLD